MWTAYRLFGLTVFSDFPFANRLAPGTGAPHLTVSCDRQPPFSLDWRQTTLAYASPHRTQDGESIAYVYRLAGCDVLRFTCVADFYLWSDRIACHVLHPAVDYLVEIRLLGPVFAFWLERAGVPALHASAVAAGGRAVAFLSINRGGKTALAASLMDAGCPLLTDDLLPVDREDGSFLGRAGYPTMRMWPSEAEHFLGQCKTLEVIHPRLSKRRVPVGADSFGEFCDAARPLSCIYIPERRGRAERRAAVEITAISPQDAVIELVRHSFTPRMVQGLGWQSRRLDFFADLVRQVPMRRLSYPSGFQHLPRVRDAIMKDLSRLP